MATLFDGSTLYVDARDESLARHILRDGFWEKWVTDAFMSCIAPGMTVLDIGANCGYYTMLAAKAVGESGHVHAFEPNPFHHDNLYRSVKENAFSHVTIHSVAVGSEHGETTLYIPGSLTGSSNLFDFDRNVYEVHEVVVPMRTLEKCVPNITADVIKLDIEGAEPLIMDDLFAIIERSPGIQIFMEYTPSVWIKSGWEPESILRRFEDHGMTLRIVHHSGHQESITAHELATRQVNEYLDLHIGG